MSSPRNDALYQQQFEQIGEPSPLVVVSAPSEVVIANDDTPVPQVTAPQNVMLEEDGLGLFRWIISDDKQNTLMGCSLLDSQMSFYDEVSD